MMNMSRPNVNSRRVLAAAATFLAVIIIWCFQYGLVVPGYYGTAWVLRVCAWLFRAALAAGAIGVIFLLLPPVGWVVVGFLYLIHADRRALDRQMRTLNGEYQTRQLRRARVRSLLLRPWLRSSWDGHNSQPDDSFRQAITRHAAKVE